ncbi:hypothetical protein D3C87_1902520 [compost metagenome]
MKHVRPDLRGYSPTRRMRQSGISADNGQGMGYSGQCVSCIKWDGDQQLKCDLVKNPSGFMCCPICHASYGAAADLSFAADEAA